MELTCAVSTIMPSTSSPLPALLDDDDDDDDDDDIDVTPLTLELAVPYDF